jgi:hypothetical protein
VELEPNWRRTLESDNWKRGEGRGDGLGESGLSDERESLEAMGFGREHSDGGDGSGDLRGSRTADLFAAPVGLAQVILAAATLAGAFAHLHAAVFVLADRGRSVDIGRADGEQHQEREEVPDEEACGHVGETLHGAKYFQL